MNSSRTPTPFRPLSTERRVSARFDFLQARSRSVTSSCDDISPRDQDVTDRLLLPITSTNKHPCLVSSTASGLRRLRVGPWHFTMPGSLWRTAWCVGGVLFPCRLNLRPRRSNRWHIRHSESLQSGMWFIPSHCYPEPRLLLPSPREKRRKLTTRHAFLRSGSSAPRSGT